MPPQGTERTAWGGMKEMLGTPRDRVNGDLVLTECAPRELSVVGKQIRRGEELGAEVLLNAVKMD